MRNHALPKPKAIAMEVNEVPLKVFRHFASLYPSSHIARLLQESCVITTRAGDVPETFLYPSQTWASFNTGVPFDQHLIHWYNDPKPKEYPFYWKILADNGCSVGLLNTLHSSPPEEHIGHERVKFLIPDIFGGSSLTKPSQYTTFQGFNQRQSSGNRRVSSVSLGIHDLPALAGLPFLGVRLKTLFSIARLVIQIALGKVARERLRNVQFVLLADIFVRLLRKSDVDLAVLFTNHIASNMHRYWYALFPEEYPVRAYDDSWVRRYSDEVLHALMLMDDFVGRMMALCRKSGRVLIINSSMGQQANTSLDTNHEAQYMVQDIGKFLSRFGIERDQYLVRAAMEPQYSLEATSVENAKGICETLKSGESDSLRIMPSLNRNVVTLSLWANPKEEEFAVLDQRLHYSDLGLRPIAVDDHHSGKHHPDGMLIIYNSPTSRCSQSVIDYLEFAPAVLVFFGIPRPAHMRAPNFSI